MFPTPFDRTFFSIHTLQCQVLSKERPSSIFIFFWSSDKRRMVLVIHSRPSVSQSLFLTALFSITTPWISLKFCINFKHDILDKSNGTDFWGKLWLAPWGCCRVKNSQNSTFLKNHALDFLKILHTLQTWYEWKRYQNEFFGKTLVGPLGDVAGSKTPQNSQNSNFLKNQALDFWKINHWGI